MESRRANALNDRTFNLGCCVFRCLFFLMHSNDQWGDRSSVNKTRQQFLENPLLIVFAIPFIGLFMGGVYSFPVLRLTKEREPWSTGLLALCLAVTVFGLGGAAALPMSSLLWVFGAAVVVLLLMRILFGSMSVEHFSTAHIVALLLVLSVGAWQSAQARRARFQMRSNESHEASFRLPAK